MAELEAKVENTKRRRTSDSSVSGVNAELEDEVEPCEVWFKVHTETLREGKFSGRSWDSVLDHRGIAARCALAALNAHGKTVRHPSSSGAQHPN